MFAKSYLFCVDYYYYYLFTFKCICSVTQMLLLMFSALNRNTVCGYWNLSWMTSDKLMIGRSNWMVMISKRCQTAEELESGVWPKSSSKWRRCDTLKRMNDVIRLSFSSQLSHFSSFKSRHIYSGYIEIQKCNDDENDKRIFKNISHSTDQILEQKWIYIWHHLDVCVSDRSAQRLWKRVSPPHTVRISFNKLTFGCGLKKRKNNVIFNGITFTLRQKIFVRKTNEDYCQAFNLYSH